MWKWHRMSVVAMTVLATACAAGGDRAEASGSQAADDGAIQLIRDDAAGAPYGAPGPRHCSSLTSPGNGGPTAEQAAAIVICRSERDLGRDVLMLRDQVKITSVGPAEPYNGSGDYTAENVDPNQPVYRIKGSDLVYQCETIKPNMTGAEHQRGSNCNATVEQNATGVCYRRMDREWFCTLYDFHAEKNGRTNVPPPPP